MEFFENNKNVSIGFEYRLYETQVKKIVKVQSMMRAFLAKRNVANKLKAFRQESSNYRLFSFHFVWKPFLWRIRYRFYVLFNFSVQKDEKKEHHHLTDAEAALAIQKGTSLFPFQYQNFTLEVKLQSHYI